MDNQKQTWHIHIKGVVQGVGFRPLVFAKADNYGLCGYVTNGADGLHIRVNGSQKQIEKFTHEISVAACPPLSNIVSVFRQPVEYVDYHAFTIRQDDSYADSAELSIAPDFALCNDCRNEMSVPEDRRLHYPFITCTNCGPRYSILNALPYDRMHTEMHHFTMCQACQTEYTHPQDRRFFSQTNSCSSCGVVLSLYDSSGDCISSHRDSIREIIVNGWHDEKIVAIKSIGGYLLTCDAASTRAIDGIRDWKHRPNKPLAMMYPDLQSLQTYDINRDEISALEGPESPIVLVAKNKVHTAYVGVCDGYDRAGVMIPYNPLFHFLLSQYQRPIVATSANISKSPIMFRDEEALEGLGQVTDYVLAHNRNIVIPQDDSVVVFTPIERQKIIVRRSRGMAPSYINKDLNLQVENALAIGADMKSTFCLFKNNTVHVSQFLGDLSDYDTEQMYIETLQHYLRLVSLEPEIILCDRHPNYVSRRIAAELAREYQLTIQSIPHHHAHFCAVLGEHNLLQRDTKVLGVIWDGSGLGIDDNIWGGEFFVFHQYQFDRCAHLEYSKHIGQDKMSREPRLSALALLGDSLYRDAQLQSKFTPTEWNIYSFMINQDKEILTSSMGRLFDAVACVLDILDYQSYQGEAASLLEVKARSYFVDTDYHNGLEGYIKDTGSTLLHPQHVLEHIISDKVSNISIEKIAAKFHITLVHWIKSVALAKSCKKLGFSGGVFQNSLLVDLIIIHLKKDFELLFHQDLPPNDENIAFGQLIYASIRK